MANTVAAVARALRMTRRTLTTLPDDPALLVVDRGKPSGAVGC